jgi:hypothetical protein
MSQRGVEDADFNAIPEEKISNDYSDGALILCKGVILSLVWLGGKLINYQRHGNVEGVRDGHHGIGEISRRNSKNGHTSAQPVESKWYQQDQGIRATLRRIHWKLNKCKSPASIGVI